MIQNPAKKILVYDENENADDDQFWYATMRDTIAGRHGSASTQVTNINNSTTTTITRKYGNVLYLDGHVALLDNDGCHTSESGDPMAP